MFTIKFCAPYKTKQLRKTLNRWIPLKLSSNFEMDCLDTRFAHNIKLKYSRSVIYEKVFSIVKIIRCANDYLREWKNRQTIVLFCLSATSFKAINEDELHGRLTPIWISLKHT